MRSMATRLLAALRGHGARLAAALLLGATGAAAPAQTVTFIHTDPAGNPVLATDANGDVVWKESYKPYGEEQKNPPSAGSSHLGFSGQPYDAATGLGYFGGRYYDPVLGRFLGVDPAAPDPNDLVHSLNRYAYGNNNPYRYVDPDGRSAVLAFALPPLLLGGAWWVTRSADQREQMVRDASRAMGWFKGLVFNEADGAGASIASLRTAGANSASTPPGGPDHDDGKRDKDKNKVRFGNDANQESHAFRHVDNAGLERGAVRDAINEHLSKVGDSLKEGLYNGRVNVKGTQVDYAAYKFADGTINVGRITPPR